MTEQETAVVIEMFTAMPFFPSAPGAQSLIGDELRAMCRSTDQAIWLVRRMSQLYGKWPGLLEARATFCSKFSPCDGIECYSTVFLDGIPSEREGAPALIASRPMREIAAGEAVLEGDPVPTVATSAKPEEPTRYYRRSADEKRVHGMLLRMYNEAEK